MEKCYKAAIRIHKEKFPHSVVANGSLRIYYELGKTNDGRKLPSILGYKLYPLVFNKLDQALEWIEWGPEDWLPAKGTFDYYLIECEAVELSKPQFPMIRCGYINRNNSSTVNFKQEISDGTWPDGTRAAKGLKPMKIVFSGDINQLRDFRRKYGQS